MSHEYDLSRKGQLATTKSTPAALRSVKLWVSLAALAVVATSFVAISASQPATAQIAAMDPDLCATTYRPVPVSQAGAKAETACRSLVAWRNSVVNHPNSNIYTNHPLLQWGTGATTTLNTWPGVFVNLVNGERVVTQLEASPTWNIAGQLPGPLPGVRSMGFNHNFLTGGIPTWIYNAQDLEFFSVLANYLSGSITGSAFNTPKLVNFYLQHNQFSGSIPNFNFARMPKLTDIVISNNRFSGPFPASWSGLADNRGIQHLQLGRIGASGDLPAWVSNLKFADTFDPAWRYGVHRLDLASNQLCVPANFQVPTYTKVSGAQARVNLSIQNNHCPTGQPESYSVYDRLKNLNVQWETVDVDGNPGLKVTWNRPSGATGALRYKVQGHLLLPQEENQYPPGHPNALDYINCPGYAVVGRTDATTDQQLSLTLTRANCNDNESGVIPGITSFDPSKYLVSVSTFEANGGTRASSEDGTSADWTIYVATDSQKTFRDVGLVAGMRYWYRAYRWDAENQAWITDLYRMNLPTPNLEPGSILAIQSRVPTEWLSTAGLSTADADTPVELQNGWNIISAGGSATRGGNDEGAFFIDDSLKDCGSFQGVIAIMRHNPRRDSFDIELPCHPAREAAITRGQAFGTIDQIDELDTLFIYFRSALPVSISWDTDNNLYAPAS